MAKALHHRNTEANPIGSTEGRSTTASKDAKDNKNKKGKDRGASPSSSSSKLSLVLFSVALVLFALVIAKRAGLLTNTSSSSSSHSSSSRLRITKRCLRFHRAVFHGKIREVEALLNTGKIDINCEGPPHAREALKSPGFIPDGLPALAYAAGLGNTGMVDLLIRHGANIHQKSTRYGEPITWIYGGFHPNPAPSHHECFARLVKAGADVNTPDHVNQGQAPIHYVARRGLIKALQLLLKLHADINLKSAEGFTALHYAVEFQTQAAQVLMSSGADVHIGDMRGRTPLHIAVMWAVPSLVQGLAEASPASVFDVKDHDGRTVMDLVLQRPSLRAIYPYLTQGKKLRRDKSHKVPVPSATARPAAGGWRRQAPENYDIDYCDFDRIHYSNLTIESFVRDYYAVSRPVVIEGATEGWPAYQAWSKEGIMQRYSKIYTLAGSIPYPDKYDKDPRIYMKNTTVENFLKGMTDGDPWILFDARMHRKAPQFLKDYVTLPPFRMCGEASPPQFSLGGYPAGAPFHSHVHAWNALIYGRKRWFLVPPGLNTAHHVDTNRPSERTLSWLEKGGLEDYKSKGIMYECVQDAGDLMFIPRGWSHATLNLVDTVNVAQEFCSAYGFEFPWHQAVYPSWYGEPDPVKLKANLAKDVNVPDKLSVAIPPHMQKD